MTFTAPWNGSLRHIYNEGVQSFHSKIASHTPYSPTPLNKQILHIAIPSIISNITVPLLALADTTITGHLGSAACIGAIALGGMIFNMVYWLFGFLRMGTSGLTAQAHGTGNHTQAYHVLCRSLIVAGGVALLLIVAQRPIFNIAFNFVRATPEVKRLTSAYYHILIWGAPAVLGLYSFAGWFLGMQNAKAPMVIAIGQNIINIVASTLLVFGFAQGMAGVATGTLLAQYVGLLAAIVIWQKQYGKRLSSAIKWHEMCNMTQFKRFFAINGDIFLRTLCLIAVTTYFTAAGSAQGNMVLAANTLLMQFFIMFSYIMDGFAYAGESIGGHYYGARDLGSFSLLTRQLFTWGMALSAAFTLTYAVAGRSLLALLTDNTQVVAQAINFMPYACAIPVVSFAAFLYDGLFIGTTSTKLMLASMAVASACFFAIIILCPDGNVALWCAFLSYLGSRSLMQALLYRRVVKKIE